MNNGRDYRDSSVDFQINENQYYEPASTSAFFSNGELGKSRESLNNKKKRHSINSQNYRVQPEHISSSEEEKDAAGHYFQVFPERTTFHGVRDCFHARHGCPRFTWIFIIVVATLAALQGCFMIVREFIARPVVVSYFIQEASRLPLPDIVICPFNRFNRTYLNSLNVSDGLAQYLELSYPSPVLHSFQLRRYKSTLRHLDEYEMSLIFCCKNRQHELLCENLSEIVTSAGKCFRIPGVDQEGDGFGYGTRVVIKLPQELYNPGVNQMLNNGIAVKLAERNRGIDHDLSFIPAGVHAIMPLSATRYDRVWCFEVCLTDKAETKCNCSLAAASRPRMPDICTTTHYAHFPSEQARFFVKDEKEWESLKNTIILEVFYTNLDYTMIKHMVAMSPSGFVAQLGGQISLWIGGSIISLIQLIFYVISAVSDSMKKNCRLTMVKERSLNVKVTKII
uniref:Uncharacterized protein n=1 Tax=Ditylenchus dipsaci TaxID=166011 RepID=A0A915DCS5_9BILA